MKSRSAPISIRRPFAIGRREVTFAEWDQCADAGACKHRPDDHGWGRGDRPVVNVSWDDAKLYLAWLSQKTGQRYRLPSEAEWEYAARAGTKTPFWWGRDVGSGHAQCETCGSPANPKIVATGSFRPNGFGLYDTAGNAAEWVEDCWNDNYRGAPKERGCLDHRRLPPARLARRQFHQQGDRRPLLGALPLR